MLSCKNLTIHYDSLTAVKDVSFDLEPKDYLCVVGENGSGKSTLLLGILGLMKPSGGSVNFVGITPAEIGYLPQHTDLRKDFPASVLEVILSGCLNRQGVFAFYSKEDKKRAHTNAERLGVDGLLKNPFTELSGGQRQRVLLARALCATDKLLLLDEPVTGLDPSGTAEMYEYLKKLNSEGLTIMMVSHDVHGAVKYANKILHMQTTEALYFGSVEGYLESEVGKKLMGE